MMDFYMFIYVLQLQWICLLTLIDFSRFFKIFYM